MQRGLGILLIAILGTAACRTKDQQRKAARDAATATAVEPKKVADADASSTGTTFEIEEKTGRSRVSLVLRLDYFPDPKPGVTNLPMCMRPLPENFDVGFATCDGRPEVRIAVSAKNLDQDCYTDPSAGRVAALQPLVIPGCRQGAVLVHTFEPRLKVDAEAREVN